MRRGIGAPLVLLALTVLGLAVHAAPQRPPQRIVSVVPAVTEMLFAIGAGPAVVGVSSYDTYPPEARTRPKVGALLDPDFERILSLRPDLVVTYATQTDLQQRLRNASIPTFDYESLGVAETLTTLRTLGTRVGRRSEADRVADGIQRDLDAVRQRVAGRPRPKTVLVFAREPGALRGVYASGGVGFLSDLLDIAGADNALGDMKRPSVQVSTELLIARAPDVVIEVRAAGGWTDERRRLEHDVWAALPSLPAWRTGRVYLLTDDRLGVPGPRIAESARMLARVLHPEVPEPGAP